MCFERNNPFSCKKGLLYDVYWAGKAYQLKVKAYLLGGNSMLIADLLYVNMVKDDAVKVLKSLKIRLFYLFCNFILSNKKNRFNKQKVC